MRKDQKGVNNNKNMQKSYQLKTFVRMESDCTLRLGLSFSMKNNFIHEAVKLVFAFLKTLNCFQDPLVLSNVSRRNVCQDMKWSSPVNTLMQVSESNITCIAEVTEHC